MRGAGIVAVALVLAGCGGSVSSGGAGPVPSSTGASTGAVTAAAAVAGELLWTHRGKFFGDPVVGYVARVTNGGGAAAGAVVTVNALDKAGTVVGSDSQEVPPVPAGGHLDLYGEVGGTFTKLTGDPARVEVTVVAAAVSARRALATSGQKLVRGDVDDSWSSPAPTAGYRLTVDVENTGDGPVGLGVRQQVILFDGTGRVVGGGFGSSDNAPDSLAPGQRYREVWERIPAWGAAVRADYAAWA